MLSIFAGCAAPGRVGVYTRTYETGGRMLTVELLDDDLVHFELSASQGGPSSGGIYTTPMIAKTDYPGPTSVRDDGWGTLQTSDVIVIVDLKTLATVITDKTRKPPTVLTTILPAELDAKAAVLTLSPETMRHVYGLGEQFLDPGKTDGDWIGRTRTPGCDFGNALVPIDDEAGNVGNAQFPVMYAVGDNANYAMFLDHLRPITWDFTRSPWTVKTQGERLAWYVMTGPDLPDLRRDYMELVGRPPVPPKKMFGLWVSEYGFENWGELEERLRGLRTNNFPVDGFVLDLQWFGGVQGGPESSGMGSLSWDTANFPDPAAKIAQLADIYGVGLMLIEEPYVVRNRPEFAMLAGRRFLANNCATARAAEISSWWGVGGLIDWTDPAAGDYWHDLKRQPLVAAGVLGHWTDLGEPERFDPLDCYYGFPQLGLQMEADVHNIYNFKWAESIQRGYARRRVPRRPFILSRSGASGIQRFGTAMWSGDIGSRLTHLAAHLKVQMHMSLSGVDYFGSDIGGFQRWALDGDLNDMYTRWLAHGAAFDVPVRPHTSNLENKHQTAPDQVGDLQSNLENVRLRYELLPYLYSLAHRAWRYGEPLVPPLAFYYQNDPAVQGLGGEKLLGRDLLIAASPEYGRKQRDVYLPAGTWINYHTGQWVESAGQPVRNVPLYVDGRFKLPMFARAGAIIPQMFVDQKTMNALGMRTDSTRRDELLLRVYADPAPSLFTLYEDDGETVAYQRGAVRTTRLWQVRFEDRAVVRIDGATGSYAGAPSRRDNVVKLFLPPVHPGKSETPAEPQFRNVITVSLNGRPLPRLATASDFDAAPSGWFCPRRGVVYAKSGPLPVASTKLFEFALPPS